MPVLSKFERTPIEVLEEITLSLVNGSFLGPPTAILTLLPISKTISKRLYFENNPSLYARIFRAKFDIGAAVRRLGGACEHASTLAAELIRRCNGLRRLKNDAYPRFIKPGQDDGCLRIDLWMAYLMFIESDGKNAQQLIHYARVDRLALAFMDRGGRFHDAKEGEQGWRWEDRGRIR